MPSSLEVMYQSPPQGADPIPAGADSRLPYIDELEVTKLAVVLSVSMFAGAPRQRDHRSEGAARLGYPGFPVSLLVLTESRAIRARCASEVDDPIERDPVVLGSGHIPDSDLAFLAPAVDDQHVLIAGRVGDITRQIDQVGGHRFVVGVHKGVAVLFCALDDDAIGGWVVGDVVGGAALDVALP